MSEKQLVEAIGKKYASMNRGKRIKTIRSLGDEGTGFIRKFFPEFYLEAFPKRARSASGSWQSSSRRALAAKTR
ncbi:MAG: hypothetical protein WBL56_13635 [Candidatus Acidiferrum sp.]